MSIKLTISSGTTKTEVFLKDSASVELLQFVLAHQEGSKADDNKKGVTEKGQSHAQPADDTIGQTKEWLSKHTASEVLSRLGWDTNPDKILLLAAFHETHGGEEGWRSSDIQQRFEQAREDFPANFPRDIRSAIDDGLIGAVTQRTYKVGRSGWAKIAEGIQALS